MDPPPYCSSFVWHLLEAPPRCHFSLVVFKFPVARLYTHCHLFVTMHLSTTSFLHLVSLTTHSCALLIISTTDTLSQSSSNNCVHHKVYFILHFIISLFFHTLFFYLCVVKFSTGLLIPFGLSSRSEHIHPLFWPSIPSALVYLHSLSFFPVARICYWYSRVLYYLQSKPSVSRHKNCNTLNKSHTRTFQTCSDKNWEHLDAINVIGQR